MKRKILYMLLSLLFTILVASLISSSYKKENYENKNNNNNGYVSLNSWWSEDDRSLALFSELFDIPEIRNKYDDVKVYSVMGDPPKTKSNSTLYVQFSGESGYNDSSLFDINFIPVKETDETKSNTIIFPYSAQYFLIKKFDASSFASTREKIEKYKFCIFAVSNGEGKERNDFFASLSKYKKVDSCGKHLNNMKSGCPAEFESSEYCSFLGQYKFMICFENKCQDNYFTEKLINAYNCNTIPIYWGCPNIDEYVNMDAIFYLKPNFTNIDVNNLIDDIKRHDQNRELYLKKYNQSLFKNDNIHYSFDKERLKEKIKAIIV